MKATTLLALAFATSSSLTPALARGVLEVSSNVTANVYLDDMLIGQTPLSASRIPVGDHEVEIENPATGEVKRYTFRSLQWYQAVRRLDAEFTPPKPVVEIQINPPPSRSRRDRRSGNEDRGWRGNQDRGRRGNQDRGLHGSQDRGWGRGRDEPDSRDDRDRRDEPVVVEQAPPRGRSGAETAKVHTRNTLIGLQVVNQLITGDRRDRTRFRNVGLGLMLLNEVAR